MTDIRFEDPPPRRIADGPPAPALPSRRGKGLKHWAIAAALRSRPGEWAFVGTYAQRSAASTIAIRVVRGELAAYQPAYAYDAVSRTVDGEYRLYARYRTEDRIVRRLDAGTFELRSGQRLVIGHRVTPALATELRGLGILAEAAVIVPQGKGQQ